MSGNRNLQFYVPSVTTDQTWNSSGALISSNTYLTDSRQIIDTRTGYVGKFPKKVKPLPVNVYDMDYQDTQSLEYVLDKVQTSTGNHSLTRGPFLARGVNPIAVLPAPDYDSLFNNALDRLNDQTRGNLDVSVDLAEAHKTAKMFDATERVVSYAKVFRNRFSLIKTASNHWLEFTYGVKPLLQTVFGAADENIRVVINKTAHYSAKAKGKHKPTTFQCRYSVFGGGTATLPIADSNIDVVVKVGLDMRTDQFDLARWSSLNPISIAWELTPYSFVVDWFYNVGGYLRQMETALLYANKFRGGYRTNFASGSVAIDYVSTSSPGYNPYYNSIKGNVQLIAFHRSLLSTYPRPYLPSLQANLGSSRLFSAASLLGQMLGRR